MTAGLIQSLAVDGKPFSVGVLRDLQGIGSPPPRQEVYDHSQRHGSVNYTAFYQPRILDIYDGIVASGDPAEVWATYEGLKGALALGTDHVITFQRAGIPYLERVTGRVSTELTGEVVYSSPNMLKWTVSFLCADPRIYNDVITTARYSPSAFAGGIALPLDFPLRFSGGSDETMLTVTNAGTFATPAVFTVDGPASAGFAIVNEETGEEIVTQGVALAAGDSLTIDVDQREVLLAGTSRPDLINAALTTWWEIAPGNVRTRLHGSGFEADVTQLTISFRDARI